MAKTGGTVRQVQACAPLCVSACVPRDLSPLRSHLRAPASVAVFIWTDSVQDCDGHFRHAHCHPSPAATHPSPLPQTKNPPKKHNARSVEPEREFEGFGSFQSLSAENEHLTVLDILTIVRYLSILSKPDRLTVVEAESHSVVQVGLELAL